MAASIAHSTPLLTPKKLMTILFKDDSLIAKRLARSHQFATTNKSSGVAYASSHHKFLIYMTMSFELELDVPSIKFVVFGMRGSSCEATVYDFHTTCRFTKLAHTLPSTITSECAMVSAADLDRLSASYKKLTRQMTKLFEVIPEGHSFNTDVLEVKEKSALQWVLHILEESFIEKTVANPVYGGKKLEGMTVMHRDFGVAVYASSDSPDTRAYHLFGIPHIYVQCDIDCCDEGFYLESWEECDATTTKFRVKRLAFNPLDSTLTFSLVPVGFYDGIMHRYRISFSYTIRLFHL